MKQIIEIKATIDMTDEEIGYVRDMSKNEVQDRLSRMEYETKRLIASHAEGDISFEKCSVVLEGVIDNDSTNES